MPYVQGYLIVNQGRPDQGLPGQQPGIDNSLPSFSGGSIDNSLPPPPGIWPPPVEIWPPVELPPNYPMPPGSIWPPVAGNRPDQSLPVNPSNRPDQGLPGNQPGIDNSLPGSGNPPDSSFPKPQPSKKYLVAIVAASGAGVKVIGYTVVDPSLSVGFPLPGNQPGIDNSLPGNFGNRPDQSLPGNQPLPGQGLPGNQPGIDNTLPSNPVKPGQDLPPSPQPKK